MRLSATQPVRDPWRRPCLLGEGEVGRNGCRRYYAEAGLLMTLGHSVSLAAASLIFAGCFAPDGEIESAPSTEAGTDGGETDDDGYAGDDGPHDGR